MNQQAYEAGKSAYQQGDWLTAVDRLSQAKNPGEVSGPVDHLVGNSYPCRATAAAPFSPPGILQRQ